MTEYDMSARRAWYDSDELYATDQAERKEKLQHVHDMLLDGCDVEEAVMTAFLLGSAEGVAQTVEEYDVDAEAPDV